MKNRAIVFCGAWLIGGMLYAGLVVRQDKNGHIVLSNTLDKGGSDNISMSVSRAPRSKAIPLHYQQKIQTLTQKHDFRQDLVIAVARAESSFNPLAVSPKGAVGIMQLMRDTARQYGVINRYNAHENIEAGVKHLKYLYEKFQGDIPLTLAAYNAGEEAVSKYKGVPPYRETRNYIRRVMSQMGLNYSFSAPTRPKTKIYKYTTLAGNTIITDTLPADIGGTLEVIN
ncbi:MAG: lytic transglycosylase domain-containing protein [Acidobacteriota bacterium]|jgi:soluble lytic murein transglycosylase-like protein|nr:lytic transglycosylase domain-containing protein [Acidobacteriota bacterium]